MSTSQSTTFGADGAQTTVALSHAATLIYSESLLRQAVFAYWRRVVGLGFVVALFVVLAGLGVLIAKGDRSWLTGAVASVAVVGLVLASAVYVVHYRRVINTFRAIKTSSVDFRAEESSFSMKSSMGSSLLAWSVVKELWQFPGVWLLLYSKAQFSTLPLSCMSTEMQTFIESRVRDSGGKIIG